MSNKLIVLKPDLLKIISMIELIKIKTNCYSTKLFQDNIISRSLPLNRSTKDLSNIPSDKY